MISQSAIGLAAGGAGVAALVGADSVRAAIFGVSRGMGRTGSGGAGGGVVGVVATTGTVGVEFRNHMAAPQMTTTITARMTSKRVFILPEVNQLPENANHALRRQQGTFPFRTTATAANALTHASARDRR